jgi:hypothetical protein
MSWHKTIYIQSLFSGAQMLPSILPFFGATKEIHSYLTATSELAP